MEPKKRWDGYVSFSSLEPGVDYNEFALSPQIGRVEPFAYPLSDEQDQRAHRLLRECVCISLHDHCGITPADMNENDGFSTRQLLPGQVWGFLKNPAPRLSGSIYRKAVCDGN
jgi:hypothetical protein